MPKPTIFVLNDEAVSNSYGFYILSSGGKLDRFNDNPVMLSNHINTNENVIGKWANLTVKDGKITAEPDFDTATELGADVSGKVERGYLKGASMGIIPNWDSMERLGDKLILKEWELAEASVVPVPSNRNSIAVYSADGKLMKEEEVKNLCLSFQNSEDDPTKNLNIDNMKKILLSVSALMALGFDSQPTDGLDVAEVEAKILGLSTQVKTLKEKNDGLELAARTAKEAQGAAAKATATTTVELAITQGKIPADKKEAFIQLGITSPDVLKTTLDAIPAKTNFSASVTEVGAPTEVKTIEDFQKLSLEGQLSFKNDKPEEYKKLFS